MDKVIQEQLQKVQYADLSRYDANSNTYLIPKKVDIKLEEDNCYVIRIKPSAQHNTTVITNWNNGNVPIFSHMKVDISKRMGKMVKVTGLNYDIDTDTDISQFWSGWISTDDIEVLKKL